MYDDLYKSLFEIVSFFNRPKQDKLLVREAGVALDTALFPLLMRIAHNGTLGIVALAEQVDRDHSTVSRQIDKLILLGLVFPNDQNDDKRARNISLTDDGRILVQKIATKRREMMRVALQGWDKQQLSELQISLDHLAHTLRGLDKPDNVSIL